MHREAGYQNLQPSRNFTLNYLNSPLNHIYQQIERYGLERNYQEVPELSFGSYSQECELLCIHVLIRHDQFNRDHTSQGVFVW